MKKIKNVLLLVLAFVLFSGLTNVKAEGKVKVYIFEAGGCPYCEDEIEYLQGLSSYGEKFEIVQKELYVDHVDWAQGKDYQLGKVVAEAFLSAGFENASYKGTPFVVISNLYAAAGYSTNLEGYIDKAYEEGDKDVVTCYANNGENCLEGANPDLKVDSTEKDTKDDQKDVEAVTTVILFIIIAGSIALVIYTGKRNKENPSELLEEEKIETKVVEEKVVKKPTNKSKTTKKSSNKNKR